jgi:hypothetical protein
MSLEIPRHNNQLDVTKRLGEPIPNVPDEYVDIYTEAIKKLGVDDESIEKMMTYMIDPEARAKRNELDNTVYIEAVSGPQAHTIVDGLVSRGRRVLSLFSKGSVQLEEKIADTKKDNGNTANVLHHPTESAISVINDCALIAALFDTQKRTEVPVDITSEQIYTKRK